MPCPSIDPKSLWTSPNCFSTIFKLFMTGPKIVGLDPKQLFTTEFHLFNHVQKVLVGGSEKFGQVQNSFKLIEGQNKSF